MLRKFVGLLEETPQKLPKIDKKEANKIYHKAKRTRAIVPSWKTEFKWLVTDDQGGTLYCRIKTTHVYNIIIRQCL